MPSLFFIEKKGSFIVVVLRISSYVSVDAEKLTSVKLISVPFSSVNFVSVNWTRSSSVISSSFLTSSNRF